MFVLISAVLGALIGALRARRANGKPLDIVQYAATFAVIFAILGLFVNIVILRLM